MRHVSLIITAVVLAVALGAAPAFADPPTPGGGPPGAPVAGPTIALTNPADGATATAGDIVISGIATSPNGINVLVVNNVVTPTAADGSFQAPVHGDPGSLEIVVVAKDGRGFVSFVRRSITIVPAPIAPAPVPATVVKHAQQSARCIVPKLVGATVSVARARIGRAGCKLGSISLIKHRGKHRIVLAQSVKRGLTISATRAIAFRAIR
jgi:hypothetical protein